MPAADGDSLELGDEDGDSDGELDGDDDAELDGDDDDDVELDDGAFVEDAALEPVAAPDPLGPTPACTGAPPLADGPTDVPLASPLGAAGDEGLALVRSFGKYLCSTTRICFSYWTIRAWIWS